MSEETLVAGAAIFRRKDGKTSWFVVKTDGDSGWQFPKGTVRRGESSVRAAIRTVGETAGLGARVLEEAGRATASTTKDGKQVTEKIIYYLMQQMVALEVNPQYFQVNPQYFQVSWYNYPKAKQKLALSREKRILSQANQTLREWLKRNK